MRGKNRTRIADRDENFRVREASQDRGNVITIGRRFFHPSLDRVERTFQRFRVRFDHEDKQILLRVRWIECRTLKCFQKFLARESGIISLAPLARPAKQHVGKRLFRQVIELRTPAPRCVFGEDSREIGGFLRQHEQLRMIVEQRHQKRGAGFGLTGDETGPLIKRQLQDRHLHFATRRNQSMKRGRPSLNRVVGL